MAKGKPYMLDADTLRGAGINPQTGLPYKVGSLKCTLKEDTKRFLRILDEQDAVNRYTWSDLPGSLTSQELERLIYYKGQLCIFKLNDEFYFTPYALDGTIDFYGRFNTIHPVPFANGEDKANKAQVELLSNLKLDVLYKEPEEEVNPDKVTVLLHDYTKQLSQTITSRATLNDPLLEVMANCIPFMNTSMLLSTGIKGIRVADADQEDSVRAANRSMERAALNGEAYVPIVGALEFQELANEIEDPSSFMMAYQSLDNLRLSGYGIKTGGIYEKKAHVLQDEEDVNSGPVELIMKDGLDIRQHFCDIANKAFGLNMSVSVNEATEKEDEVDDTESTEELRNEDIHGDL